MNIHYVSSGTGRYRYGFNGMEKDDAVKGAGNSYDFGARIYDSRLARFLSVDRLFSGFPWNSHYSYAENRPVDAIDADGFEKRVIIHYLDQDGNTTQIKIITAVDNQGNEKDLDLKDVSNNNANIDVTNKKILRLYVQNGKLLEERTTQTDDLTLSKNEKKVMTGTNLNKNKAQASLTISGLTKKLKSKNLDGLKVVTQVGDFYSEPVLGEEKYLESEFMTRISAIAPGGSGKEFDKTIDGIVTYFKQKEGRVVRIGSAFDGAPAKKLTEILVKAGIPRESIRTSSQIKDSSSSGGKAADNTIKIGKEIAKKAVKGSKKKLKVR